MKSVLALLGLLAAGQAFPQIQSDGISGRIIGGDVVTPHELPYQLSLRLNGSHICGASVLDADFALTAAQCAAAGPASSLSISAGDHNLEEDEGTEQIVGVANVSIHSNYSDSTLANDIAILRLASPLNLTSYVQPISIPSSSYTASGIALVSGWGATKEGGNFSATLRKVYLPILTRELCGFLYGSSFSLDSMICAGYTMGGRDFCDGDTGGPLVIGKTLAGIVSFIDGCAQRLHPGVYTEVAKFSKWINSTKVLMSP